MKHVPCRLAALALLAILSAGCSKKADLVTLPATPAADVLISNVDVLHVDTGEVTPGQSVLISGGKIAAVGGSGAIEAPAGAQVIDGNGAMLLPGLIDVHGHVANSPAPSWLGEMPNADRNLQSYLYSGVTTVLDPADLATEAFKRRDAVAAGKLLGPRIYAAGPMVTAHGGHPVALLDHLAPWWIRWYLIPRMSHQVDTPEEARAAAAEIAGLGADVMKLAVDSLPSDAPRIKSEVIKSAVEEAKRHKLRAVAHIGSAQDAIDAADAGIALWVHGVYKERLSDEQVAKLASYKIPMVATMEVFDSYARLGQEPRIATMLEQQTASAEVLEAFNQVPADANVEYFRAYLEELRKQRPAWVDNVRRLHEAGVTILAGSDAQSGVFPGPGLHRELQQLTKAGLTPLQAIRAATLDAARFLESKDDPSFGVIAPGKEADLLLVEGDPTQDLEALARIRSVIKDGVVLERHAIK